MLKQVTYDNLNLYIDLEPCAKVIKTGDEVVMITHDISGVICEDNYGAFTYEHNELEYTEDVEKQKETHVFSANDR